MAVEFPVRRRSGLGHQERQERATLQERQLPGHHAAVLGQLRRHRQSQALGLVGRPQLRQRPAWSGGRDVARRRPDSLPAGECGGGE